MIRTDSLDRGAMDREIDEKTSLRRLIADG